MPGFTPAHSNKANLHMRIGGLKFVIVTIFDCLQQGFNICCIY